jgi:hypothetical protein
VRERIILPFGEGLARGIGTFQLAPSSMDDLRNVHLDNGSIRIRLGLLNAGMIENATDILAVHPLRGMQQSLVVAYSSVTREAWLVRATIDPTTLAITLTTVTGGTLWTLPVQAPFPRVVITDSYNVALIAHDEPQYALRQQTKVYSPSAGTVSNVLLVDGAEPIKYRGVSRYKSYVVGWGYGFDDSGPPDERARGEVFRLSYPGEPTAFDAMYYLLVGQRDEPIVGGAELANGFLAAKESALYLVVGTRPADFDWLAADPNFGMIAQRAGVVRGDGFYFWSAEGPRVTTGGASVPIGRDFLNLRGAVPDELLAATDYQACFAIFRPEEDEIEWVFPIAGRNASWSYTLHAETLRFSYRPYRSVLRCAGLLAGNIAFDPDDPGNYPYPEPGSFTVQAGSYFRHTVSWNNTNIINLPVGSVAEIWGAAGLDSGQASADVPWTKIREVAAAGASQEEVDLLICSPRTVQPYRQVAVRYRRPDGSYYSAYASANPLDWPANSRLEVAAPAGQPALANVLVSGEAPPIVEALATHHYTANLDAGTIVEVWGMGGDTLGGPAIAPDTWQKLHEEAVGGVVAVGPSALEQEFSVSIGQVRKHVALRYRFAGFAGDDAYYAHSVQTANPWTWPSASRGTALYTTVYPQLSFAWDSVGGINRSPGTLTITVPDNNIAPDGDWVLDVRRVIYPKGSRSYPVTSIPGSVWDASTFYTSPISNPKPGASYTIDGIAGLNDFYQFAFAARLIRNSTPGYPYDVPVDGIVDANGVPTGAPDNRMWPRVSRLVVEATP